MHATWNSTLIPGSQESGSNLRHDATRIISRRDRNTTLDSENENDMLEVAASVGGSNSSRSSAGGVGGGNSSNSTTTSLRSARILLNSSTFTVARRRFVLLAALLGLQSGSQLVLQQYEELIKNHVVIVLFLSMVVGAGGNAGNQAAVSVITALLAARDGTNIPHNTHGRNVEAARKRSTVEKECSIAVLTTTTTAAPVVPTAGRSFCRRLVNCLVRLLQLPRVLLGRRWRRLCGDAEHPVGIPLAAVLRYELLVGLCCGLILMTIGALRVGFFVWWDDEDYISRGSSSGVASTQLTTGWGSNGAIVVGLSLSLFLIVFLSVLIGATLPYILLYFGANVEHAAPIVQVLMDLLGTWICCTTCNAFLPSILESNKTAGLKE
ncbi:putative Mg transporter [Trypanosoma theileri]|uniref:Putative Mg transporter n=1 Tax=Trypanosoma theileri TaxID=67003 RepID=A0A1X0NLF3_9TRYP|nr:putative Mg transporter [Trypanosoma theileri]ORC85411.1 putative Mg transporter [Trypanosoma theileri]